MSKAFTREDSAVPEPPVARRPSGDGGPVRLTPEGHAAYRAELEALTAGDAPDGGRLALLADLLARAEVIAPPEAPARAAFGVWVTVEDEDGALKTWRLVGPEEADAREGRLSLEAPMGRALLGREVGERVVVQRPLGALELEIRELRSVP